MVIDSNKCIISLTMVDKLQYYEIKEKLLVWLVIIVWMKMNGLIIILLNISKIIINQLDIKNNWKQKALIHIDKSLIITDNTNLLVESNEYKELLLKRY